MKLAATFLFQRKNFISSFTQKNIESGANEIYMQEANYEEERCGRGSSQARNQFGAPGWAKSFLRVAQI